MGTTSHNPLLIQPIELLIGGKLGIEDEMLWWLAMLTLPELDETKDLLRFLTLADVGI